MGKRAVMETTKGEIVIDLFEKEAPNTVANFVGLATGTKAWTDPKTGQKVNRPFYDGLSFHRVIAGFVAQGGCPLGTGTGGPGFKINCETKGNPHKHVRGALSMAHAGLNTGGSQFFLVHDPQPHLDGKHTVFGQIVKGVENMLQLKVGDRMTRVTIQDT
ncbi:MAG: peptidylprolyl isomerase [Deltaproteobacteria bacterium]|nr:peptidylprolyl isomerase [Deltaproteobacteria bacterium]